MTADLYSPALSGMDTAVSANLRLNEVVADRRQHGRPTLHLAFGEAHLPLLTQLRQVLAAAATSTAYAPVAGTVEARESLARWFGRRGLPTDASQVVLAPGSKPVLFAIMTALAGDVYLPAPCWNSYAPQVRPAGRQPIAVPISARCGGLPDPDLLAGRIHDDLEQGRRPAAIMVNTPDNPTGTTAPADVLRRLCALASSADLVVISDEIYRDLQHDDDFTSPAELLPGRTIVCTGLSKSLAIGGWRIGGARFPSDPFGARLRQRVLAVASHVWSGLAAPMQAVATYAFDEPAPVAERLRQSRRMHGSIARACYEVCRAHGARVRRPTGGFYVYADFERRRRAFERHGVTDSDSLATVLLAEHDIAVLGGHHLGDDPRRLAFKMATTGFIGETSQEQLAALTASDASQLPHVRDRVAWLDRALAALETT